MGQITKKEGLVVDKYTKTTTTIPPQWLSNLIQAAKTEGADCAKIVNKKLVAGKMDDQGKFAALEGEEWRSKVKPK